MHTDLVVTRRQTGIILAGMLSASFLPVPTRAETGDPAASRFVPPGKLRAAETKAAIKAGTQTLVWSLDDTVEGPRIRAKVGEPCSIAVYNDTPLPLSLHWHGARIDNAMDGVGGLTQAPIAPSATFTYAFTPKEPGTWLIRPCIIGNTSEPAGRGLTGLLVVEEATPPAIDMELCAVIDDWLLNAAGQLAPFRPMPLGRLGSLLTVNGRQAPVTIAAAPGGELPARLRLRIANACNARSFRIRFDRLKAYVIAVDGQPTDAFEPLKSSLPFSPGNRFDVIFDIPTEGDDAAVIAQIGDGLPLLIFKPQARPQAPVPEIAPPSPNPNLPLSIRLQDAVRQDFIIGSITGKDETAPSGWTVNGIQGRTVREPAFSVRRDTPVVLAIRNDTPVPQPIHVHGHCFRILHPFDDGWDPFWMDTFQIPAGSTQRVAFIADMPGKWLIASSICERFDSGLWNWFEVT